MIDKQTARRHRYQRTRAKIRQLRTARLSVQRTPKHIYAQVVTPDGKVIAAASTVGKAFKAYGGNIQAAQRIGRAIAEQCQAQGVDQVAFDRSGFKYHGRVRALADAARAAGLKF